MASDRHWPSLGHPTSQVHWPQTSSHCLWCIRMIMIPTWYNGTPLSPRMIFRNTSSGQVRDNILGPVRPCPRWDFPPASAGSRRIRAGHGCELSKSLPKSNLSQDFDKDWPLHQIHEPSKAHGGVICADPANIRCSGRQPQTLQGFVRCLKYRYHPNPVLTIPKYRLVPVHHISRDHRRPGNMS